MTIFAEYDPLTGIKTEVDYDADTGDMTFHRTADVEAVLEHTKMLANDSMTDKGIKKGWWLYAKIPPIIQLKLMAKGIDMFAPDATAELMKEINTNYPYLKCTQKNEGGRTKIIVSG